MIITESSAMSCEAEETQETEKTPPSPTPSTSTLNTTSVVFEAATQTPTSEQCDSPLFTQKGYCLQTTGHSCHALTNIHKMRQHDQVT